MLLSTTILRVEIPVFTPLVYALVFVKEDIPDYKSLIVSRLRPKPPIISPTKPPIFSPIKPPIISPIKSPIFSPTKPPIISPLKPPTFVESLAKPIISSESRAKSPVSSKSPITKPFQAIVEDKAEDSEELYYPTNTTPELVITFNTLEPIK